MGERGNGELLINIYKVSVKQDEWALDIWLYNIVLRVNNNVYLKICQEGESHVKCSYPKFFKVK